MPRYGLHGDFSAIKWIRFQMVEILILEKLKTISEILKMNFGRKTTQYRKKFWSILEIRDHVLKYPSDRQLYFWHLVYSHCLFEYLSNPMWRTAHVTAGWLCRDPNVNVICSLRSKIAYLVTVTWDFCLRLGKNDFRSAFEIRVLVYQDKWLVQHQIGTAE